MTKPSLKTPATSTALAVVENKPVDLAKIDASQMRNCFAFDEKLLAERALAMMQHIEGLKKERAVKGILAGIYLAQIKASLGHGEFNAWCAKYLGKSKRMGEYYMALAAKFSRSSKLLLPEVVAANQLSLDLKTKGSTGAAFMAKLDKFVGALGLTELMQKHGVIQRGGYQQRALPPAETPGAGAARSEEELLAIAEAAAFQQCTDAVAAARKTLTNELRWSALTLESAGLVDAQLKSLAAEFHELLLKARHAAQS